MPLEEYKVKQVLNALAGNGELTLKVEPAVALERPVDEITLVDNDDGAE